MSIRRREGTQPEMWVPYHEINEGPGHRFCETLNELLREAQFDRRADALCGHYYESSNMPGRRSVAPGVCFRMRLIGYFEGIESERGLEWCCADSLSLRRFLGMPLTKRVADHTTLSKTRQRLPLEVHQEVFSILMSVVDQKGLLKGRVLGVKSRFLRADASMKAIVRGDTAERWVSTVELVKHREVPQRSFLAEPSAYEQGDGAGGKRHLLADRSRAVLFDREFLEDRDKAVIDLDQEGDLHEVTALDRVPTDIAPSSDAVDGIRDASDQLGKKPLAVVEHARRTDDHHVEFRAIFA